MLDARQQRSWCCAGVGREVCWQGPATQRLQWIWRALLAASLQVGSDPPDS